MNPFLRTWVALGVAAWSAAAAQGADAKILLIAGKPSHPPGMHEFRAGCLLLQQCLAAVPGVTTLVHSNGWPSAVEAFDGAAAVIIYADGGGGHPAIQEERRAFIGDLVKRGVGFGCMHYACEVPKDKGGAEFLEWLGGYYEHQYSVNPIWTPEFAQFPAHPVTRGVKPFGAKDEWYFNLRWAEDLRGYTPILVATPSDQVRDGPYVWPAGPYPHIQAAKGRAETMMWVREGDGGRRAFGFTGGHFHDNWGQDAFRKVVLNAILWVAKVEVPLGGVASQLAPEVLTLNLDPKKK